MTLPGATREAGADRARSERLGEAIANAWGTTPRIFSNVLRQPIFDAKDLFDAVTADPKARGVSVPMRRVMVNGQIIPPTEVPTLLPRPTGTSVERYAKQIRRRFSNAELTLILDNAAAATRRARDALTPVFHSLFSRVGYPAVGIHTCIYAGTYRTTPFGIHIDDAHVLMACAFGRKRMAFWPRAYFEGRPELLSPNTKAVLRIDPRESLDGALLLEIGPRDLLYWPQSYWHVAMSDTRAFNAALSVGIYHRASLANMCRSAITLPPEVRQNSGFDAYDRLDLDGFRGPADVPPEWLDIWARARASLTGRDAAAAAFARSRLRSVTSAGFGPEPRSGAARPGVRDRVRCGDPRALAWARVGERLVVGANGAVFEFVDRLQQTAALLRKLRAGATVSVRALLALASAERHEGLLEFLGHSGLVAAGAARRRQPRRAR